MGAKCCTDRKPDKADLATNGHAANGHAPNGHHAVELQGPEVHEQEYEVDPVLQARATMKDEEALQVHAQLHGYIGTDGIVIGVIGEAVIQSDRTKAILMAVGGQLARDFKGRACLLTCGFGEAGVQAVFSEACSASNPLAVYDMQPRSNQDPLQSGQMVIAGNDVDHMLQIYTQVCDIYITAEGSDLVTEAVMLCGYWGAVIIPLILTGGASGGECHFPKSYLSPPPCVSQEDWAILSQKEVTPQALAQGMSKIITDLLVARQEAVELHKKHGHKLWNAAAEIVAPKEKKFCATKTTSAEEAKHMEELDFEAIMAAWKPGGGRGGVVRSNIDLGRSGATSGDEPSAAPAAPPKAEPSGRDTGTVKIAALPPPSSEPQHDEHIDEIAEMRKRMEARLEQVHVKTSKASTKLQAVYRGKQARKVVQQMKDQMKNEGILKA